MIVRRSNFDLSVFFVLFLFRQIAHFCLIFTDFRKYYDVDGWPESTHDLLRLGFSIYIHFHLQQQFDGTTFLLMSSGCVALKFGAILYHEISLLLT